MRSCTVCAKSLTRKAKSGLCHTHWYDTFRQRNENIARLRKFGYSVPEIARICAVSVPNCRNILARQGLSVRQQKYLSLKSRYDAMLRRAAEIAGATPSQVASKWRSPKILVHVRWAIMTSLHQSGASYNMIAKWMNRDHTTVIYGIERAHYFSNRHPDFAAMVADIAAAGVRKPPPLPSRFVPQPRITHSRPTKRPRNDFTTSHDIDDIDLLSQAVAEHYADRRKEEAA